MTQRLLLGALATSALALALPTAGCGGFSADDPVGAGGAAAASGGTDAGSGGAAPASGGDTSASSGGSGDTGDTGDTSSGGGREEVPDATCENVTACDGDPTGTWFAMKSCMALGPTADLTLFGIGCTEAAMEGTMEVTGNFKIDADGTISDNTSTSADLSLELQPECLIVSATMTQCSRIGGPIIDGSGADTVDCVESTVTDGGCTCTVTFTQSGAMAYPQGHFALTTGSSTNASGTLTVSGTISTEDANSPGPEQVDYDLCVDGNFLHVTPTTASTIWGVAAGDIVLQRQE